MSTVCKLAGGDVRFGCSQSRGRGRVIDCTIDRRLHNEAHDTLARGGTGQFLMSSAASSVGYSNRAIIRATWLERYAPFELENHRPTLLLPPASRRRIRPRT